MSLLGDRIKMSSASAPGTGTVTLSAALQGYQTIDAAGIPDGASSVPYTLENSDRSLWETGLGTKVSATSFQRDEVTAGSSGAAVLVNFVTAPTFYITPLARTLEEVGNNAAETAELRTITNSLQYEVQALKKKALFIDNGKGRQFFDSHDTTTYLDLAGSTNEDVTVAGLVRPTLAAVPVYIPIGAFPTIGNMNSPLFAFDTDTAEVFGGNLAFRTTPANSQAWDGLNFTSSPKIIWQVKVYGSSNRGYAFTSAANVNPVVTIGLYAKNGAAPTGPFNGTLLGQAVFTDGAVTATKTILSSDKTTAWDYVWVVITSNSGASIILAFAEVEFYSPPSVNNLTLQSTLLLTAPKTVNKAYITAEIVFANAPTLNTDLIYEVSSNNGVNWTALTMAEVGASPDPFKKTIESPLTTIASAAKAVKYRIRTVNNPMVDLNSTELVIVYD